jgi:hypothetical protein
MKEMRSAAACPAVTPKTCPSRLHAIAAPRCTSRYEIVVSCQFQATATARAIKDGHDRDGLPFATVMEGCKGSVAGAGKWVLRRRVAGQSGAGGQEDFGKPSRRAAGESGAGGYGRFR